MPLQHEADRAGVSHVRAGQQGLPALPSGLCHHRAGCAVLGVSSSYGPYVGGVWTASGAATTTTNASAYISAGQRLLPQKPYGLAGVSYLKTTACFFCPADNTRRPYVDPPTGWGPQVVSGLGSA